MRFGEPGCRPRFLLAGCVWLVLLHAAPVAAQAFPYGVTIAEINPVFSTLHATDPNGGSGGRINSVIMSVDREGVPVFYAASGGGGLYKSEKKGAGRPGDEWVFLRGHRPMMTWDLAVHPELPDQIYASSLYDGRAHSLAGVNISLDAGRTWARPASFRAPRGFCDGDIRALEPSGFGIAIDPDRPHHVYVGTNCGLAVTRDRGSSWTFVDPTPGTPANDVWDVVVHHGGVIDTCGADGHRRSVDGGSTWSIPGVQALPVGGPCSLAASPFDADVLFAVTAGSAAAGVYESADGGASWTQRYPLPPSPIMGSVKPFVAVSDRPNVQQYNLWFGEYQLWRRTCSATAGAAAPQCGPGGWSGPYTRTAGGHDMAFALVFDRQPPDRCPLMYASIGGVYLNVKAGASDCNDPMWDQPRASPRALALQSMAGVNVPGVAQERLYFGTETGGHFFTKNAGDASPGWVNYRGVLGFDVAATGSVVLYSNCCYTWGRSYRMYRNDPGLGGEQELDPYPPGYFGSYYPLDGVDIVQGKRALAVTSEGVYVTPDVTADPIQWTALGAPTLPYQLCGGKLSVKGRTYGVFVQEAPCTGIGVEGEGTRIWVKTITGLKASGWRELKVGREAGKFGVFDVDPGDPDRIIASLVPPAPRAFRIVQSTDGGASWQRLTDLEAKLTANGRFKARNARGPYDFFGMVVFEGYVQPSLLAFDPLNAKIVVAGGVDSGVFISLDRGQSWTLLTDPLQASGAEKPHIPRPRFAYFDHAQPNGFDVYVGSGGRGVWRIRLKEK